MNYFELNVRSNFSFLSAASHPYELVRQAAKLGYGGLAITDECSMAGIVRAHVEAKKCKIKLLIGANIEFEYTDKDPSDAQAIKKIKLLLLCPCREAYAELCSLITLARRRAQKGDYRALVKDIEQHLSRCLAIWLADNQPDNWVKQLSLLAPLFPQRLWIGYQRPLLCYDYQHYLQTFELAKQFNLPLVAQNQVLMHDQKRFKLHHCLTAIKHNQTVQSLGTQLIPNAEHHLRSLPRLKQLYPPSLLEETSKIAALCHFSLDELRYEYPDEVLPANLSAQVYLKKLVADGAKMRWPNGVSHQVKRQIDHELEVIHQLSFEHYFLTVFDIVHFAKSRQILCQGRGSAANSAVCYCLNITEVDPQQSTLLFERFISKERNEPPDIDIDFEHQRREEVIQYIYKKYSRGRAALAATVITYRLKSAIRDVGKALAIDPDIIEQLTKSLAWWEKPDALQDYFNQSQLNPKPINKDDHGPVNKHKRHQLADDFYQLVMEILKFPRHLSQHVGGFIITKRSMSSLVPVENASMIDRTVIQWDKYDIEALGLLKIDILGLGMLTMIRKCLSMTSRYSAIKSLADIPKEDPATYQMLAKADTVGVFQIESRAQMSMLPRLKPQCFYDLVVQIAIIRPGPIQGKMVHPYLKRRNGEELVSYPNDEIKSVLERTLGVPIFQEQVIKLAMVAAGFSGGQADQLRRAMASWGHDGNLLLFRQQLIDGMLAKGHSLDFAERLFEQIKGFGSYGFPESHSASFAILAYFSAWLKRHHSAAFYCALLNSQPMGFYSPSQLVQDARQHQLKVLPVDIDHSHWFSDIHSILDSQSGSDRQPISDNQPISIAEQASAETESSSTRPNTIRLGLHLIKGFNQAAAERLIAARNAQPFSNIQDLVFRARLQQNEKHALVKANALPRLAKNRHIAQWQSLAIEPPKYLLAELDGKPQANSLSEQSIRAPNIVEDMVADYHSTGLTLNQHPISILRHNQQLDGCKNAQQLAQMRQGQFVKIAGLVTCRQRPASAAGVLFMTLEDETGNSNIIVWKRTLERFKKEILTSQMLLIKGKVERETSVVHVIAGHIEDISDRLAEFAGNSRDFH